MPKGIDELLAAGGTPKVLGALSYVSRYREEQEAAAEPKTSRSVPVAEPFPLEVLPGKLADFVREVAASTSTPPDFAAATLLVVAGAAVGNSRGVQLIRNVWEEFARFYLACVGHPGSGKSPAMRSVWRPVFHQEKVRGEQHKAALLEQEQAELKLEDLRRMKPTNPEEKEFLAEEIDKCKAILAQPLCLKRTLTVDATMEALVPIMESDPRGGLLLAQDELTGWVGGMNAYRGGRGRDRQNWLSAWSGEGFVTDRKSNKEGPSIIERPFINVVGGLPPDMLSTLADAQGRGDGFCDRILFVHPPTQLGAKWTEQAVSDESRKAWTQVLKTLSELEPDKDGDGLLKPVILELQPEARQAWVEWWNAHADEINNPELPATLLGPNAKMKSYGARLVLIVHLLRLACKETSDEQSIDLESMNRGLQLVRYFKSHLRVVYDKIVLRPEDNQELVALDWIRRREDAKECTARDLITNKVAGLRKATEALKVMTQLEDGGFGEIVTRTAANGRKTKYFVLKSEEHWNDQRND